MKTLLFFAVLLGCSVTAVAGGSLSRGLAGAGGSLQDISRELIIDELQRQRDDAQYQRQIQPMPEPVATLRIASKPSGARITEKKTGKMIGTAPLSVFYRAADLQRFRDAAGCYRVLGFDAAWEDGTTAASTNTVRMCGGSTVDTYDLILQRQALTKGDGP